MPPSDPQFDRSKFTDEEFIELLLFENNELKSTITDNDERIRQLEHALAGQKDNLASRIDSLLPKDPMISSTEEDGIPQRSARRKKSTKTTSVGEDQVQDRSEDRKSISSITSNGPIDSAEGIPLSSNFKSELSAASALTKSLRKSSISANSHTSGAEVKSIQDADEYSLTRDINNDSATISEVSQLDALRQSSEISMNSQESENQRRRGSISTANSYKPRIKLPAAKKSFDTQLLASQNRSLMSDDVAERSNILPSPVPISQSSPSKMTVKEESTEFREKLNAPQLPRTPEAFTGAFGKTSRSGISASMSDEPHNYFDSPFLASPSQSSLTPKNSSNIDIMGTPVRQTFTSTDSFSNSQRPSSQTPGSSFHVLNTPKLEEEDVPLFIKPEEFHTIRIKVVSTITKNAKRSDEINCTFSIHDKDSGKEMWRVRKSFSQLVAFDNEIRPVVEFFGLPPLPEKHAFSSTTPLKVDARKNALQDYFNTIFVMPHIPQIVLYRICRYISLDFVNPLDDFRSGAKKEGYLIRRYKGLGTTWKVRWCQVDGPALEIYENPGGALIEQIRLSGSQIGRQSSDTIAEDRGYRHAFLILELKSSKISGSYPKHFFCAESDVERDEWVSAMVEFAENDPLSQFDRNGTEPTPTSVGEILNDDFERSSKYLSGMSLQFAHLPYDDDNKTNTSEETGTSVKDSRKPKKRSLFPFRNKTIHQNEENEPNANDLGEQTNLQSWNPIHGEQNMQVYLDQLNLSEELAKHIFGREIKSVFELSHHRYSSLEVPSIIFRCLDFLNKTGAIYEEGIFRLSGSASTIRQLKDQFNTSFDLDLFGSSLKPDIHTVAGLLKTYLRELPEPIFGRKAYNELQSLVAIDEHKRPMSQTSLMMRDILHNPTSIDQVHSDFCVAIFGFLRSVIAQSSINRMTLKNVCIVFVPTLNVSVDVLSLCLVDFDCIFGSSSPIPDKSREVLDLHIPTF